MTQSSEKIHWATVKVGDICKIKHGFAFKGEHFTDSGHYILLTPGNFFEGGGFRERGDKQKYYVGEVPDGYILHNQDLVVAMTEQGEGLLGSPALIPIGERYLHNQRIGLIEDIDETKIDKVFLYFLFHTKGFIQRVSATASGAKVRHTSPNRIYEIEISIPNITIQKKIAAILSTFDHLIENNAQRIERLNETARLIYREWFIHNCFPDHEKAKMVDSGTILGKVPEGWDVKAIGDIVETLGGGTPSTTKEEFWQNGEINWYSPVDLTKSGSMFMRGSKKKITKLGLEKSAARLFPASSVMLTSRATVGEVAINTTSACTNQGFITCIPNERVSLYQIYFWLEQMMPTIMNLATGATFKEISKGNFRKLPIVLLPEELNIQFTEIMKPIFELIRILEEKNDVLKITKDFLLPKLISGQLSVA